MSRVDRKELSNPQISALREICSGAAGWTTLIASCYSSHVLVSYTSSKLLSLSDLGFFLNFYFTESQNSRVVWKGP